MSTLHLSLLGPPELRHGERILTLPTRKALAVLIYLAVEGGTHTRKRLSELFWPELDAEHGRAALRATLQHLRTGLAENQEHIVEARHLHIDRDTLAVDFSSDILFDLHKLHTVYKQSEVLVGLEPQRPASLRTAMLQLTQIVRGEFLAGFSLRDVATFDDWTRYHRDTTHRYLRHVYERLTMLLIESGETEQALETVTRWLAFDPLDEQGYQHLMRLYVMLGDRSAALRIYQVCYDILLTELHMEPMPETVALAEQIRASSPGTRREYMTEGSSSQTSISDFMVPLVGRAQEFHALVQNYQWTIQGQARIVLIEGEAGIGKTRLANDVLIWARSQGATTLHGQAFEMGGTLPYQPIIDAVRPLLTRERALHEQLADIWLAECSRIFPELREHYPSLPTSTSPEEARSRLFEALARLIQTLVQGKPFILFVDDVQWADTSTLDLLLYLVHFWKTHGHPVLLLCGSRSPEKTTTTRAPWMHELKRSGSLTHLHLGPITQADIFYLLEVLQKRTEQLSSLQDKEQEQMLTQVSQWLYRETEGHPFYLLEMLKEYLDRHLLTLSLKGNRQREIDFTVLLDNALVMHHVLPGTVSELIMTRVHRLTQSAQNFLVAGAVLGKNLNFEHLYAVAGLDEQEGLRALDEVIQVALLRERADTSQLSSFADCYQFTHDKIREVVYTQATTARRRIFHHRALKVLQSGDALAADIARHAEACGEIDAAFRYWIQAGDEAMEVFAIQDAIMLYKHAYRLLNDHAELLHTVEEEQILHLYLHLGRAYEILEQWGQAQHTYETMLTSARTTQNYSMTCIALNHLAFLVILQAFDIERALVLLQEAQHIAVESHDQHMEAEVAWNLAQTVLHAWRLEDAQYYGLRALTLARSLDIPELIARSLYVLSTSYLWAGQHEQSLMVTTEAIALYAALETQAASKALLPMYLIFSGASPSFNLTTQAALVGCLCLRLVTHLCLGNVKAGLEDGRRAVALSLNSKNSVLQAWSLQNLNHMLLEEGLYEEALATALHAFQLIQKNSNVLIRYYVLILLGLSYQALFMLERAQDSFEEAIALMNTLPTEEEAQFLLVMPWLCVNQGLTEKWHEAAVNVKEIIRLRQQSEVVLTMREFTSPYETRALLSVGQKEEARREVERLGKHIGVNRRYRISYLRSLALLAFDDGDVEQAILHLLEGALLADKLGLPGEQWQIQAVLSELFRKQGNDKQADEASAQSVKIIYELAGRIQNEDLRSRFLQAPQIRRVLKRESVVFS